MDRCIYEMKMVQADKGWFKARRYPRFDTKVSYQILYYSMAEIEDYIKNAIDNGVFPDLICFLVYEHSMNKYGESRLFVYDKDGIEANTKSFSVGDIVDILNNDKIVLGLITEVKDGGYMVMTTSDRKSLCFVDKLHVFMPHYKIPVRTEQRLMKLLDAVISNQVRGSITTSP